MTLNEIQGEINGLKLLLLQTDYKDMKLVEALAQGKDTSEFTEIMVKRQAWRDRINELEKLIEDGEYGQETETIIDETAQKDESSVLGINEGGVLGVEE